MSFDMAKDKIKNKSGNGDNFVERKEFRLMIEALNMYFEYYEFFICINDADF